MAVKADGCYCLVRGQRRCSARVTLQDDSFHSFPNIMTLTFDRSATCLLTAGRLGKVRHSHYLVRYVIVGEFIGVAVTNADSILVYSGLIVFRVLRMCRLD